MVTDTREIISIGCNLNKETKSHILHDSNISQTLTTLSNIKNKGSQNTIDYLGQGIFEVNGMIILAKQGAITPVFYFATSENPESPEALLLGRVLVALENKINNTKQLINRRQLNNYMPQEAA